MCFLKFNDVRHLVAATVRCGHGEPRAQTTLTDILAPSKLQFLAALEQTLAMWRAIMFYPRCVGKRCEVCSPPFARVCVPLNKGHHRSSNCERLHVSGPRSFHFRNCGELLLASLKAVNGNRLTSEFIHARVNVTSLGMNGAVLAPMFMTQSNMSTNDALVTNSLSSNIHARFDRVVIRQLSKQASPASS